MNSSCRGLSSEERVMLSVVPFETVLKTDFILQEQIRKLTNELQDAKKQVRSKSGNKLEIAK